MVGDDIFWGLVKPAKLRSEELSLYKGLTRFFLGNSVDLTALLITTEYGLEGGGGRGGGVFVGFVT